MPPSPSSPGYQARMELQLISHMFGAFHPPADSHQIATATSGSDAFPGINFAIVLINRMIVTFKMTATGQSRHGIVCMKF